MNLLEATKEIKKETEFSIGELRNIVIFLGISDDACQARPESTCELDEHFTSSAYNLREINEKLKLISGKLGICSGPEKSTMPISATGPQRF